MRSHFLVLSLGAALVAAGCGSVSTTGGTGGSGGPGTGGTAGAPATGGHGGTTGAAGTGGTGEGGHGEGGRGEAGHAGGGHGGETGTGGHAGGGGSGGHGGATGGAGGEAGGAAGNTGKGGHAGGGGAAGGSAGAGGHGGQSCEQIAAAFDAAVPVAESCTPGATHQCEQEALVNPLNACPGCGQYVNDATTLNALRALYDQQGCPQHPGAVCPAILCIQPRPATCVASDASSGGTCTPGPLTATN